MYGIWFENTNGFGQSSNKGFMAGCYLPTPRSLYKEVFLADPVSREWVVGEATALTAQSCHGWGSPSGHSCKKLVLADTACWDFFLLSKVDIFF